MKGDLLTDPIFATRRLVATVAILAALLPAGAAAQKHDAVLDRGSADTAVGELLLSPRSESPLVPPPFVEPSPHPAAFGPWSLDLSIARAIRDSGLQQNRGAIAAGHIAGFLATPGTFILPPSLFLYGEAFDDVVVRDLGIRAGEAMVLTMGMAAAGKMLVGRARPDFSPDDPRDFQWARGFQGDHYQSLPSFHAASIFATAAVLTDHLHRREVANRALLIPALYTTASLSALSRLLQEKHWMTDIVSGALLGTLSGVIVAELN